MKCPLIDLERKACHTQPVDKHPGTLLETKACSTLCELSDNICAEDQPPTPHMITQYSCSPWRKHQPKQSLTQPTAKTRFKQANKENCAHQSKVTKKAPTVAIGVVRDGRAKPSFVPKSHLQQDQGITIVTILTRKRSKLNQIQQQRTQMMRQALANPTPLQQQHPKLKGIKKQEKNKGGRQIQLFGEHWKVRHVNNKCKQVRKVCGQGGSLEMKKTQGPQGRRNSQPAERRTLEGRRMSEEKRREEYCSNNPLTRLLYKKYLSTISLGQSTVYQ